jgi:hypothetical protein
MRRRAFRHGQPSHGPGHPQPLGNCPSQGRRVQHLRRHQARRPDLHDHQPVERPRHHSERQPLHRAQQGDSPCDEEPRTDYLSTLGHRPDQTGQRDQRPGERIGQVVGVRASTQDRQ